jgi:hypothetical protein
MLLDIVKFSLLGVIGCIYGLRFLALASGKVLSGAPSSNLFYFDFLEFTSFQKVLSYTVKARPTYLDSSICCQCSMENNACQHAAEVDSDNLTCYYLFANKYFVYYGGLNARRT